MHSDEKLALFVRSLYQAQAVALFITVPIALGWFGYGTWSWLKLRNWVEVQAAVDRVQWDRDEWDSEVLAGCYKFTTRRGETIETCGKWDEAWNAHQGDQRQLIYNPEKPKRIARSRTEKLKWPLRIIPGIYAFATVFYGFFTYRWARSDHLLAGPCRTIDARIIDISDAGYSHSDFGSEKLVSLLCRWRDPDLERVLEFRWNKTVESVEQSSVTVGDLATIRFSTEDPSTFQVMAITHPADGKTT
jgi:hypothetical protein